ncbi:phosphatase phospho-type [Halteromyces radiatus]|uniref:phosphatase phospho-type n=1 Tax=Halteromyces radiatus TaxID=101107 RepID=UPI00221EBB29|nr:phosphatase phospho-type [Halteromyces radiatus]KAI8088884.1 phosphatase phospho-type [Halteromyces radiatus]
MKAEKNIAFFDFDWSLIEQDSDFWTISKLSEAQWNQCETLKSMQWTDLMDRSICELQDNGVTLDQFENVLQKIPFTPAMIATLKLLKEHDTQVVILSDANTFYIETILKAYGVRDLVHDIITNPAYFDDKNRLRIRRRILATAPPHNCPNVCALNICKGQEIDTYIRNHGPFQKIIYVGDGKNDYCPATRLREQDRMFVRSGKALARYLERESHILAAIKAKITYWDSSEIVRRAVEDEKL